MNETTNRILGAYWLQPTIRRHDSAVDMMEMAQDATSASCAEAS